ncbi:unnamed protein product [Parnassius apollo]|uniref:(apollo) hypothetical protein n=1 Tax=Parnassius apollo TaxID=110799 RepID=A0A8S3XDR1_PARAO|nr:unnamed protein product [Parnassius apollo]
MEVLQVTGHPSLPGGDWGEHGSPGLGCCCAACWLECCVLHSVRSSVEKLTRPRRFPRQAVSVEVLVGVAALQKLDGDVMNICQQSVSRIITTVSNLIALQMKMFVKFPSTVEDINQVKQKFFEVAQFPG